MFVLFHTTYYIGLRIHPFSLSISPSFFSAPVPTTTILSHPRNYCCRVFSYSFNDTQLRNLAILVACSSLMSNNEPSAQENAPLLGGYERQHEPSDDEAAPPTINAARWQVKTTKSIVRTIAVVQCAIIGTGMLLLICLLLL